MWLGKRPFILNERQFQSNRSREMRRSRSKSVLIKNPDRITRIDDPFIKIRTGDVEEVRDLLLSGRMNPNKTRWSGFSLLHRAAEIGHTELCLLLLDEGGISVNVRSTRGWYTPLHIALANGYLETANALINRGADPWARSKYGEDPFDYGAKRGFRQLCDEFRTKVMKEDMKRSIVRATHVAQERIISHIADEVHDHHRHDDPSFQSSPSETSLSAPRSMPQRTTLGQNEQSVGRGQDWRAANAAVAEENEEEEEEEDCGAGASNAERFLSTATYSRFRQSPPLVEDDEDNPESWSSASSVSRRPFASLSSR